MTEKFITSNNLGREMTRLQHGQTIKNFDDIVEHLGSFGTFQQRQYVLLCLPIIVVAFHTVSSVFLAATPNFRCQLPAGAYNGTDTYEIQNEDHREAIIRYIQIKDDPSNISTELVYDSCHLKNHTDSCTSFVYSKEFFESTIVTEWNIVCGDSYKSTLSTSVYYAGVLTGAIVIGILSDLIGRKKMYLTSLIIIGSTGLAAAFSPNIYVYIVLRFFNGCAEIGLFDTAFVLGMELMGPKHRLVGGVVIEYFFALGYVLLPGITYLTKRWNHTLIALSAPSFAFLIYYWIVNESARWLISKKRLVEAKCIIKKAAKVNRVSMPEDLFEDTDGIHVKEKISAVFHAPRLLFRILILYFNWIVVALGYFGLSLNSGSLGGNIYINFLAAGLVEFPAYTICFLCHRLGRKRVCIFGMMVGGSACIGAVLVDRYLAGNENINIFFVTLNMIGKFGMTISYAIIYFWSAEIFPTTIRNSLMGMCSFMAGMGSIIAPFIADVGKFVSPEYEKVLAPAIFGSLVIAGGILSCMLPDTTDAKMPDTVHDANNYKCKANRGKKESISFTEEDIKLNNLE